MRRSGQPVRRVGRIPQAEWDRHKDTILSLATQHEWKAVCKKMKEEHGFDARPDQYDYQMRVRWEVHKNLKRDEWQSAIHAFDNLLSRHQSKIRMCILGAVVSEKRLRKARQRYCQSDSVLHKRIPSHVSFEFLSSDGTWTYCTETMNSPHMAGNELGRTRANNVTDRFSPEYLNRAPSEPRLALDTRIRLSPPICSVQIPNLDGNHLVESMTNRYFQGVHQSCFPDMSPVSLTSPIWPIEFFHSTQSRLNSPRLLSDGFHSRYFVDLPHMRVLPMLADQSRTYSAEESRSLAKRSSGGSRAIDNLLQWTRDGAKSSSSSVTGSTHEQSQQRVKMRSKLTPLLSILPNADLDQLSWNSSTLVAEDETTDSKFRQLLVYSALNGFAGLAEGEKSSMSLLKVIGQHGNLNRMFNQILKSSPNYVAKAVAESVLKMAIEAEEIAFIELLLSSGLVDVNRIVCKYDGRRYIPIERAVSLRNVAMVKSLLRANADPNASLDFPEGALGRLSITFGREEASRGDDGEIVELLLEAGAQVSERTLTDLIRSAHNQDFVTNMLSHFINLNQTDFISEDILGEICEFMGEKQINACVKEVLRFCESVHRGSCLQEHHNKVEWALVQGAKRGFLQVVEMLLPYVFRLNRALSASIQGGNRLIITAILAKEPDISGPAHTIYHNRIFLDDSALFTPLSQALYAKDEELIQACERLGALDHLNQRDHFEAALSAASATGNLHYVQELLRLVTSRDPECMAYALVCSIRGGHDEISSLLLDSGAGIITRDGESSLATAISQRNSKIVRSILDTGEDAHISFDVFLGALKWGNRSVLLDLIYADKDHWTQWDGGVSDFNPPEDLFRFLMDYGMMTRNVLNKWLQNAIREADMVSINRLIDLGADPGNSEALILAARFQPAILQRFIERIPRTSSCVIDLVPSMVLVELINHGLTALSSINALLRSQVVNLYGFAMEHSETGRLERNPTECTRLRLWDNYRPNLKIRGFFSPMGLAVGRAVQGQYDPSVVIALLNAGYDANAIVAKYPQRNPDIPMMTALLVAIEVRNVDLVKLLISHGATVNAEAARGVTRTPLQRAAELGYLEIVKLLLDEGANVNAQPSQRHGGTALQFAARSGNCNIAAMLLDRGADIYANPSKINGRWPLEAAAEHGRLDMLDFLLKVLAYPDVDQCKGAIKLAQENGHMGCSDMLQEWVNQPESGFNAHLLAPSPY